MKRALSYGVFCTVTALVVACSSSADDDAFDQGSDPTQPAAGSGNGFGGSGSGGAVNPSGACTKMDIVFVIDNSGSMGEEQTNLIANFPKFVSVLDATTGGGNAPLDYRVAVTTTGKTYNLVGPFGITDPVTGDSGAFRHNCGGDKPWLERADAAKSFACRAEVGTDGPSEEMPLECMKLALKDRIADGTNGAFLRDDALLAVVFLTDEDDCSFIGTDLEEGFGDLCEGKGSTVPEVYVTMLDTLKGDRAKWATAVIAGKTDCSSTFGSAAHAKRLERFVDATGANAVFSSICDGDLSGSLKAAIDKFGEACQAFPVTR